MASEQFVAFQEKMASNPVPPPPKDIVELRARIDGAMGQLPLAAGTSAVAVSANGVDAFLEMRDQPETVGQHGAPHGETILGGRSRQRRCCADVVHLVLGPNRAARRRHRRA